MMEFTAAALPVSDTQWVAHFSAQSSYIFSVGSTTLYARLHFSEVHFLGLGSVDLITSVLRTHDKV